MNDRDTGRPGWTRVLLAGFTATTAVTVTMYSTGTDILSGLGTMILGGQAGEGARYLAGTMAHLGVGLTYAVVFALLFAPVAWNAVTKGIVFGFVITVMALVVMPLMAGMLSHSSPPAANPCHTGRQQMTAPANPCAMENPCHPDNPCATANPCAMKNSHHPGNPCATANPCNPCSGGSGGGHGGLLSLLNHVVFGLVLSLMIGGRRRNTT